MKHLKFNILLISAFILLTLLPSVSVAGNTIDSLNNLISSTNDKYKLLKMYDELSQIYLNAQDTNAVSTSQKQYNIALSTNNNLEIANACKNVGKSFKLIGNTYEAIDFFIKEANLRDKNTDKSNLAFSFLNIGECYRQFSEYLNAINYLEQALEIFKFLNSKYGMAKVYNRLGAVYFEFENNFDKAIQYSSESNKYASEIIDKDIQSSNYIIIGSAYIKKNEIKTGIKNLFKALEFIDNDKANDNKSLVYKNIADAYRQSKKMDKALEYSYKAYYSSLEMKINYYQLLNLHSLFTLYQDLGKIDSAYKYLLIYRNIENQYFNKEKERMIFDLQTKYQREQFNKNILAQEKQKIMTYIIFSISTLFILTLLLLIYHKYGKIRKINKQLLENKQIIESQKDELTKSIATKDKFISIIAHDINNPLHAISLTTEYLTNFHGNIDKDVCMKWICSISKSTNSIISLVQMIMQWARAQSNQIEFAPEEINLSDAVEQNILLLNENANAKQISLKNNVQTDETIFADVNMIYTVLRNLISNAIKFTESGGEVIVGLNKLEKNDFVNIYIKDNGVGISENNIEKLFRIDSQFTSSGTNEEKGTGLGLILCKEFVNKHGGNIWVESVEGNGSTFYFSLPKSEKIKNLS